MSQPALKTLSKSVIKEAALILTIALLSIGGAVLFYAIEGGVEASAKNEIKNLKGDLVKKLVQKSGLGKARAVEFKKETNKVFQEFEEQLLEAYNSGSLSSETSETVWSFTGSLFYVGTVFTTVGYGNIYPTTTLGKLLTIAYASVTIPLVLIFLDALGKIFTRILKAVPEMGRVFYYSDVGVVLRKAPGVSAVADKFAWPAERPDCAGRPLLELIDEALAKADESFDLPLVPALAVLTAYTAGGALMYSLWEDLDFLDAFYFVFITISTIGFGDVLPEYPALMILTSLYVFVGLGVCSMVINVIVEVLQRLMVSAQALLAEELKKQFPDGIVEQLLKEEEVAAVAEDDAAAAAAVPAAEATATEELEEAAAAVVPGEVEEDEEDGGAGVSGPDQPESQPQELQH